MLTWGWTSVGQNCGPFQFFRSLFKFQLEYILFMIVQTVKKMSQQKYVRVLTAVLTKYVRNFVTIPLFVISK